MEKLGAGGFGRVWRARNRLDGVEYAVKAIKILPGDNVTKLLREVNTLSRMHHENIVRYYQARGALHLTGLREPVYPRLQPYASQAATVCTPGCNRMHPRLQPYVSQAWIDEVEVVSAAAQDAASVGQAGGGGGGAAGRSKPAMPGAGSQPGSQPGLLPPAAAFSNDVSYDIFERPSGRPSNQSDGDGWADGGWATSQGGGESSSEEEEDEDEDEEGEEASGPKVYVVTKSERKRTRGALRREERHISIEMHYH